MKKHFLVLLTFVSAIACLCSCDEFPMLGGNDFVLEETEFILPAEGGSVEVKFIPVTSWSAQCADSFVKISPVSGEASEEEVTILISVEKNTKPLERVIKVLLTIADQDIVLTITQAQATNTPETPDNPDPEKPYPDNPDPENPKDPDDPDKPEDGYEGGNEDVIPGEDIEIETK